ncbi:MAG: Fur family transcriptional regulator [Lachnospiraceae bacterium]|nr:Fur family transcriptional regulator [Lachnospiraceae bacterium]
MKENVRNKYSEMKKEIILERLKEDGCRITKQRLIVLDIILSGACSCCKEIFYEATKRDKGIGQSTVYRMISLLEEIGAINRKNMYKISCEMNCEHTETCQIELDDDTVCYLSLKQWNEVMKAGLSQFGYRKEQEIRSVNIVKDEYEAS